MACPRCVQRGKTWQGDDPVCAFENGVFRSENWACATMNDLRELVDTRAVYNEDQYGAILPVFEWGEFLVMSWYKRRGRTEGAWINYESEMAVLRLLEAEKILEQYATGSKGRNHDRPACG